MTIIRFERCDTGELEQHELQGMVLEEVRDFIMSNPKVEIEAITGGFCSKIYVKNAHEIENMAGGMVVSESEELLQENEEYEKLADELLKGESEPSFITIDINSSENFLEKIAGKHKFDIGQTIYSKKYKKIGTIRGFKLYENKKIEYVIDQTLLDNSEKRQDVPIEWIDEEDYEILEIDS